MQPQGAPAVNMQPILEALARRQMGGGGTPMSQQVSMQQPGHPTPMQGQPGQANPSAAAMPSQVQQGGGAGQSSTNTALASGQAAQGPNFDPETRDLAKSLVQRLLKGL